MVVEEERSALHGQQRVRGHLAALGRPQPQHPVKEALLQPLARGAAADTRRRQLLLVAEEDRRRAGQREREQGSSSTVRALYSL